MAHSVHYSKHFRKPFLDFFIRSVTCPPLLSDNQIYWLLNLGMLLGWLIINISHYIHHGWFETQLMTSTLTKVGLYMILLLVLKDKKPCISNKMWLKSIECQNLFNFKNVCSEKWFMKMKNEAMSSHVSLTFDFNLIWKHWLLKCWLDISLKLTHLAWKCEKSY